MPDGKPAEIDFAALQRRLDEVEARLSGEEQATERRAAILEERARAIAGTREVARERTVSVLAFSVGGERYAIDVEAVGQVLEAKGLCPLPAAPPWLLGAMVARTRIVPVLDLRQLLGLQGGGLTDLAKVVVAEHEGEVFGIAVEGLEGRIDVPVRGLTASEKAPFRWIAADRLALLDLGALAAGRGEG
ncbi:MAG TPA: chemotaxis protein CheW [Anaeromyxobacteraceae bacterium]|nr:chemotaxis protein CheW [Anaeromyxobacteraceae bacterium]